MLNLGLFWYCLLEVLIRGSILPQKHYSLWTISKPPQNQLKLDMQSIGGEITSYVKFGLILIFFSWGFNLRFNSAAETLLFVNHKQKHLRINWNFIFCVLGMRSHHMYGKNGMQGSLLECLELRIWSLIKSNISFAISLIWWGTSYRNIKTKGSEELGGLIR